MDLTCGEIVREKYDCNFAEPDPTMSRDPRIIPNLLSMERSTIPKMDYFRNLQKDIQPFMRKIVATWMLEVNYLNNFFLIVF